MLISILSGFAGALLGWLITHIYYRKSSKQNESLMISQSESIAERVKAELGPGINALNLLYSAESSPNRRNELIDATMIALEELGLWDEILREIGEDLEAQNEPWR